MKGGGSRFTWSFSKNKSIRGFVEIFFYGVYTLLQLLCW